MSDDDVLMGMEMVARAERKAGFDGYGKPPAEFAEAVERLIAAGFAERSGDWVRPTIEGAARIAGRIHTIQ